MNCTLKIYDEAKAASSHRAMIWTLTREPTSCACGFGDAVSLCPWRRRHLLAPHQGWGHIDDKASKPIQRRSQRRRDGFRRKTTSSSAHISRRSRQTIRQISTSAASAGNGLCHNRISHHAT